MKKPWIIPWISPWYAHSTNPSFPTWGTFLYQTPGKKNRWGLRKHLMGKSTYINGDVYYRCFHQVEKIEKKNHYQKRWKKNNFSRLNPSSFRMLVEATYPIWLAFVFHRLAPGNRAFQGHGPPGPPWRSMPTSNLHDLNKCHGPTASQFPKKRTGFPRKSQLFPK